MSERDFTVTVADDNRGVLELVSRALRMHGYQVLEANSGPEALDVAERHDRPVDLLLTDVEMPGMDGIELSRSMRTKRPETKVIFMSGNGTLEELDGTPFLSKPFAIPELLSTVKDTLLRNVPQTRNDSALLLTEAAV
jgi:two-component system cell cycle sensor histidine kinase/response regulator CckA